MEGPRAPLSARYARALATADAAELDAVSRDFEAMGDVLAAADAAAHAATCTAATGIVEVRLPQVAGRSYSRSNAGAQSALRSPRPNCRCRLRDASTRSPACSHAGYPTKRSQRHCPCRSARSKVTSTRPARRSASRSAPNYQRWCGNSTKPRLLDRYWPLGSTARAAVPKRMNIPGSAGAPGSDSFLTADRIGNIFGNETLRNTVLSLRLGVTVERIDAHWRARLGWQNARESMPPSS